MVAQVTPAFFRQYVGGQTVRRAIEYKQQNKAPSDNPMAPAAARNRDQSQRPAEGLAKPDRIGIGKN